MEHSTQTTIEHVVTFTDAEAEAFGHWLLALHEVLSSQHGGLTPTPAPMVLEMIGDLANHLNGVD